MTLKQQEEEEERQQQEREQERQEERKGEPNDASDETLEGSNKSHSLDSSQTKIDRNGSNDANAKNNDESIEMEEQKELQEIWSLLHDAPLFSSDFTDSFDPTAPVLSGFCLKSRSLRRVEEQSADQDSSQALGLFDKMIIVEV